MLLIIMETLGSSAVSVGLWHFSTRAKSSSGAGHRSVLWNSLFRNLHLLQDHLVDVRGKPGGVLDLMPLWSLRPTVNGLGNSAVIFCLKIPLCCSLACRSDGGGSWAPS